MKYIREDQQAAGKPYGKAKEISEEDEPVFEQAAECDLQVVINHGYTLYFPLYHYIFQYSLSIQHTDDAVTVTGIMLGVGYHHDGSSLLIEVGEQRHYFITIG